MHAVDLVREEISELLTSSDHQTRTILQEMKEWRAYGSGTSGFAIGFPPDFLSEATEKAGWYLAPCIYDPSDQRTLIKALVEEILEQNIRMRAAKTEEEEDLPPGGNLYACLNTYAPILKDCSFREEREWRMISRPLMYRNKRFDFRQGSSLLIPYYKFPLADKGLTFRLHEVVVGPTPDERRSKMSLRGFLVHCGLKDVPIEVSRVPYRNW